MMRYSVMDRVGAVHVGERFESELSRNDTIEEMLRMGVKSVAIPMEGGFTRFIIDPVWIDVED